VNQATGRARTLVGFAALGIFWGSWGADLPDVQSHAGAGDAALGIALFCIGAGALVAMRPAGVLVDRGGRWVLPAITAAFAISGFLPSLATSPVGLAAVVVLLGATSGSLDVAINAEGVRSEAVGRPVLRLAHGIFSAAAVCASVATGGLRAAGAGPAAVLGTMSGLVLASAVIALALEPAPPRRESTPRLRELLRAPRALVVLGGLCALAFFVEGSWQSWGAVQLQSTLGATAAVSAAAPALFAAAMACGRIGGQDIRGPEWVLLAIAAAVAAAGTLVGATASTAAVALLGIVIAGVGISICAPTLIAMAGRGTTAERRGSAVSVVTTVAYLGFLLGPAAVGVVAHATSLRAALGGVAVVALVLSALAAGRARARVGALLARGDRG
jgi:predicted MFS family arabinose efflux permease